MATQQDDLGQLSYISSSPDFNLAPAVDVKPQDELDLPALERVLKVLKTRKAQYQSIETLTYGIDLTVENQLIINTRMVAHIDELESLITSTILMVKEHLNGQR